MPEKLTLAVYLERRGAVKALTRIEAEVFRVPYPLVKGWAHRHGADEITQAMLGELQEKIGRAKSSTAAKAQRGLNGLEGISKNYVSTQESPGQDKVAEILSVGAFVASGFVVRRARRYRLRPLSSVTKKPA